MNVTEEPLDGNVASSLPGAAREGAELAGVNAYEDPLRVVTAINEFLVPPGRQGAIRTEGASLGRDLWTDWALPLGSLWGETLGRRFDWTWISVVQHDHDDLRVVAVANEDRSLVVYPFHYCFGCLANDVYPTVLLAYNMLDAGRVPAQPAGGYLNLMDGVRHVVPPA